MPDFFLTRLLAAPITVEGTDKVVNTCSNTEGLLTTARLEIMELLNDQPGQDSDLLVFLDSKAFSSYPDLQLSFSHRVKKLRGIAHPRTELKLVLKLCMLECLTE
jgi:hypothetical protein